MVDHFGCTLTWRWHLSAHHQLVAHLWLVKLVIAVLMLAHLEYQTTPGPKSEFLSPKSGNPVCLTCDMFETFEELGTLGPECEVCYGQQRLPSVVDAGRSPCQCRHRPPSAVAIPPCIDTGKLSVVVLSVQAVAFVR